MTWSNSRNFLKIGFIAAALISALFFFRLVNLRTPSSRNCYRLERASREAFDRSLNLSAVLLSTAQILRLNPEQRQKVETFEQSRAQIVRLHRTGEIRGDFVTDREKSEQYQRLIREFYDTAEAMIAKIPDNTPALPVRTHTVGWAEIKRQWALVKREIHFSSRCPE